jgi:hypothetical protein
MKREIPLPAIVAVIVAIMLALGFIGWRVLSPPAQTVNSKAAQDAKDKKDGGA